MKYQPHVTQGQFNNNKIMLMGKVGQIELISKLFYRACGTKKNIPEIRKCFFRKKQFLLIWCNGWMDRKICCEGYTLLKNEIVVDIVKKTHIIWNCSRCLWKKNAKCMQLMGVWYVPAVDLDPKVPEGHLKNAYELLNLRALKFPYVNKIHSFQWMGKIFCVEFQRYLWNSAQNILPIHWKIEFLCNFEILRALRFKSSYVSLKCTTEHLLMQCR